MGEKFHRSAAEFSRSAPRSRRSVATSNLALHRGPDRLADPVVGPARNSTLRVSFLSITISN